MNILCSLFGHKFEKLFGVNGNTGRLEGGNLTVYRCTRCEKYKVEASGDINLSPASTLMKPSALREVSDVAPLITLEASDETRDEKAPTEKVSNRTKRTKS